MMGGSFFARCWTVICTVGCGVGGEFTHHVVLQPNLAPLLDDERPYGRFRSRQLPFCGIHSKSRCELREKSFARTFTCELGKGQCIVTSPESKFPNDANHSEWAGADAVGNGGAAVCETGALQIMRRFIRQASQIVPDQAGLATRENAFGIDN
jgi:hypothetical protein